MVVAWVVGFLGGDHRKLNIAAIAVRDLRIRLSRSRLDIVEILATKRLNKLPVDKVSDLFRFCHQRRLNVEHRTLNPEVWETAN